MRPTWRVSCVLATLALVGCASSAPRNQGVDVPPTQPTDGEATAVPAARPNVHLTIDPTSSEALRPRVEKLLSTSGLDAALLLDGDPEVPADYTIKLKFGYREVPLRDLENIWTATDAMLLTLYPATCNRYLYSLSATVEDGAGHPVKAYSLQETDTAWVWLLVGPKCSSPEGLGGDGLGNAAEQLLKELYRRMARDHVLEPERMAAAGVVQGPLIYVTGDRALDLIKEGFLQEDAPLRLTFDPAESSVADYRLHLDLSFSGRQYSAGRAFFALMTAGLSGMCPTQTATLEGSVSDRDGEHFGHYRSDVSWHATMSTNCALEDERDKPELVLRLARELKAELAANPPPAGATSSTSAVVPLVAVQTNAARTVVERVALARRPFQRVAFAETTPGTSDYLLDLQFTASGGGPRAGPKDSIGKQMAVGAMFGLTLGNMAFLCQAVSYGLAATLQDATGTVVAHYELSRSETNQQLGCGAPGEPPAKVAEALLEQLCREMSHDPRLPAAVRGTDTARRAP